ncbi:Rhodanese-like domain-containing protein [Cynara cardunculus var. scolymus]|uniref:Rhodanese-like domain-containing protein n=1 Tax=Cynara cardunculus var. scolymus TaxID=59895 RepID=A0A103Y8R6_CYNCS|nr:Rhodanese-like domain-containing protein [Cynara cardunculus var. scolymus]
MMVALTSVTPHSSSSCLQSKLYPNPPFLSHSNSVNENSTCCIAIKPSTRRRLTIRSAATKPAKTPAEEDWKTKRELLLEKRTTDPLIKYKITQNPPKLDNKGKIKEYILQVRSVDVKEALRLQQENKFVILDVRPEAEFKEVTYFIFSPRSLSSKAHPPGAINVQIYRLIKEWTAWDIARRAAFAFFGIFAGTEENPEFMQGVESKLDKSSKIIVACSSGGTMKPTQNLPEGQQSRSLIAAYLLVLNGYSNVFHLEGGLYQWFKQDLPLEKYEARYACLLKVVMNSSKREMTKSFRKSVQDGSGSSLELSRPSRSLKSSSRPGCASLRHSSIKAYMAIGNILQETFSGAKSTSRFLVRMIRAPWNFEVRLIIKHPRASSQWKVPL